LPPESEVVWRDVYLECSIQSLLDPKAYTKPWTAQKFFKLKPDWQIQEYVCAENNKNQ
jgi:hypothetical protein